MAADSVLPTDAREAKLGQQPVSSEANGEGGKPARCQYALLPTSYKTAILQSVPFNLRKVIFSSSLSRTPSYSCLPETRTRTKVMFKQNNTCEPVALTYVEISQNGDAEVSALLPHVNQCVIM